MISANTQGIRATDEHAIAEFSNAPYPTSQGDPANDFDLPDWDCDSSLGEAEVLTALGAGDLAGGSTIPRGERVPLSPELTRNRLTVHNVEGMVVIDFGRCEIWDGSDLCILRETMACLLDVMQYREVGINMSHAKSLASGFFGLLHDWHLRGVTVRLYNPQPCVKDMLWFREFCAPADGEWYVLERRAEAEELELMTYARLSRPTWRWGRPDGTAG